MMKVTVLYTPPADADAFEAHYTSKHSPLVLQMPGLVRLETARQVGTPDGSPSPYYRTAELYFADMDALGAAFGSDPGKAAAKDAADLCARTGSTPTFLISAVDD